MNKAEMIQYVADATGSTLADSTKALNAMLDGITGCLANGGKVTIVGFGTFHVHHAAERMARNPRTGQEMKIPARKVPKFSAGKGLKEALL